MLIVAASRGNQASLQVIDELRMIVDILTDDTSGRIIFEDRPLLSYARRILRGISSMWPDTPTLVAEDQQSVKTLEDHQSSSGHRRCCNITDNRPPTTAQPLILLLQGPSCTGSLTSRCTTRCWSLGSVWSSRAQ